MPMYSKKQAQIKTEAQIETTAYSGAQVGALLFDKVPTAIPAEYFDYNNIFSAENAVQLSKHTKINNHIIELEEAKQPLFGDIYSLGPIKLKTLKTYIKTNLANGFIYLSKSFARAPILFNKKLDRSFRFYIDYWGLNNITIRNQYLLPLISESLNWLG